MLNRTIKNHSKNRSTTFTVNNDYLMIENTEENEFNDSFVNEAQIYQ